MVSSMTEVDPYVFLTGVSNGMKMGVSSQEIRGLVGTAAPTRMRDPYGPPYYPREVTESLGSAATSSQDPIYSDPLSKVYTTLSMCLYYAIYNSVYIFRIIID